MATVFATVSTPGPPGPTGPAGYSPKWIVSNGTPSAGVGNNGDMYQNSLTGDIYGPKTAGAWGPIVANIKGAAGATGATGAPGYSPLYIVAAGPPAPAAGNNGDMYLNSTTSDLYGPKTAGVWGGIVANIKGATGPQGPPGTAFIARGQWLVGTTYAQGDEVTDVSQLYISLQSGNLGHVPASSPTWWQPLGSGGSQTPWLSNINGGGFNLSNVGNVSIGGTGPLLLSNVGASANNLQLWKDTTPTAAASIGLSSPLSGLTSDVIIATFNGSAWADRMRITNAGLVGIGTTGPLALLDIVSTSAGAETTPLLIRNVANTQNTAVAIAFSPFTGGIVTAKISNVIMSAAGDKFGLAFNVWNGFSNAEAMRIVGVSGVSYIGMGMPAPTHPLHLLVSAATARYQDTSILIQRNVGSSFCGIGFSGVLSAWPVFYSPISTDDMAFGFDFGSGIVEKMRITSNGNVAIGSASPSPGGEKLSVVIPFPKTTASPIPSAYFLTNDATGPFGLQMRLIGAAGLGNRSVMLQTGDVNTLDGGNLLLQPGGGNVGIGTASPGYALEVVGAISSSGGGSGLSFKNRSGTVGQDFLWYTTGGVGRLYNQAGGFDQICFAQNLNTGIGMIPGAYRLDVAGDVNCTGAFRVNGTPISGGGIATQSVVTGSRAMGTTYSNGTGKPMFIFVSIWITGGASGNSGGGTAYTDSANPPTTVVGQAGVPTTVSGGATYCTLSFWVLPGNFYRVIAFSAGSPTISLQYWTEWS